jgi:hypothetical protein
MTVCAMASWFETRGFAALLTMRVQDLILRSALLRASRRMKPPNWTTPYNRPPVRTRRTISSSTTAPIAE